MNEILLRRKNKVIVSRGTEKNDNYVCTMMKNIEDLGYTFSKELYEVLITMQKNELFQFYLKLIEDLKENIGANVNYNPMYPNFPESVMEKDESELYLNAIIHYWSNGTLFPVESKKERLPLFDTTEVKVIDLGNEQDLISIFNDLCASKTSISETDKEDLSWIYRNMNVKLPDVIPFKENVALVGELYITYNPLANASHIQKYFKTATDVLRLITQMSDGDVSLSDKTHYRSFKRKERRLILELLENCSNIEEDMLRHKTKWIRIGEKLHPGEYRQFPKVNVAFSKLRNNVKIETFNSKLDLYLKENRILEAISLLKTRPGEFARKLALLIRKSKYQNYTINAFKGVAKNVSVPVLLQVKQFFEQDEKDIRVFFPKGSLARSYVLENETDKIDEKYKKAIVSICENALIEIFKEREFLGKVFLSEDYKNYAIPFSQRNASKTLKTITRGSRLPFDENTKVIRPFIWWTNTEHKVIDVDLSAVFMDENWNYLNYISYTKLKLEKFGAYHSGDIVNGGPINGDGSSEFIDINIEKALEEKARYALFQVYNYSEVLFSEMEHAMFGWMSREEGGEIYEPKTVEQKMDLNSHTPICLPVILDLKKREMIWCDMGVSIDGCRNNHGGMNLESNVIGTTATCYAVVNNQKSTLYDLISLHVKARGILVENKEDADVVFDTKDGITPYDLEIFMNQYL